jgi:hypothetical protein
MKFRDFCVVFLLIFAGSFIYSKPIDRERGLYDSNKSANLEKKGKKFRCYYESVPEYSKKSEAGPQSEKSPKTVGDCRSTDCEFLLDEDAD